VTRTRFKVALKGIISRGAAKKDAALCLDVIPASEHAPHTMSHIIPIQTTPGPLARHYFSPEAVAAAVAQPRAPLFLLRDHETGALGVAQGSTETPLGEGLMPLLASIPAVHPEWLGSASFNETHHTRLPYVAGAMAHGIASVELVLAMAQAEMLAFFGAGGLPLQRVERAIERIRLGLLGSNAPWGANLIHSPTDPDLERAVADLYIERGVRRVSASAYMQLTLPLVRYALSGLRRLPGGAIERQNHVFAKVSRPEVAQHFMSPAPRDIVDALLAKRLISTEEAELSRWVPLAEDITAEADSGGHTDGRPLSVLLPMICDLRDQLAEEHGYDCEIRVGAAGGIGAPAAAAAAFAMGAAYVLTGSINQACVEAGTDERAKEMLAQADLADVMMAPAPMMFELGAKVQVLRRGTLFPQRAQRLHDLHRTYQSLEEIPGKQRAQLEKEYFRQPIDEVWQQTREFFAERDPAQIERAEREPRHKMALVFRWYLGKTSRWAITGDPKRVIDYQVWCGPSMGAFNRWAKGSFLEQPENRLAVQVALNLMEGAAVITRAQQLRSHGLAVPSSAFRYRPRPL
jgi:trans-AT polyketide synthase/acyltransferase/oxidoreductase domain-containing protein